MLFLKPSCVLEMPLRCCDYSYSQIRQKLLNKELVYFCSHLNLFWSYKTFSLIMDFFSASLFISTFLVYSWIYAIILPF